MDVPGRRTPRSPDEFFVETRRRLRKLAQAAEGEERRRALRALGYCQDRADADFLKEQKAFDALLLLGDPAGLEGEPRLEDSVPEQPDRRHERGEVEADEQQRRHAHPRGEGEVAAARASSHACGCAACMRR